MVLVKCEKDADTFLRTIFRTCSMERNNSIDLNILLSG